MKIGITGHQDLDSEIIIWLQEVLEKEINNIDVEKGFTSLAIGADQIFAIFLNERKIPIVVIVPSENYERTFDSEYIQVYIKLLQKAESIIELDFEEPTENAFYRAGKVIAENSDILFAIWNGEEAKGLGGTADIVNYMKSLNKKIIHFNTVKRTVTYIN